MCEKNLRSIQVYIDSDTVFLYKPHFICYFRVLLSFLKFHVYRQEKVFRNRKILWYLISGHGASSYIKVSSWIWTKRILLVNWRSINQWRKQAKSNCLIKVWRKVFGMLTCHRIKRSRISIILLNLSLISVGVWTD